MLGDLDALLVASLACGFAGVAVLVCSIGAVRDLMYGRNLPDLGGDLDEELIGVGDDQPDDVARVVDGRAAAPSTAPRALAAPIPAVAATPANGVWVRVLEDVEPKPARRQRSTPAVPPEPVHTGEATILERVLSGIRSIPEVRSHEPDADPDKLAVAASEASMVATGHARDRMVHDAEVRPVDPVGIERADAVAAVPAAPAGEPAADSAPGLLPLWVPPVAEAPTTRTVGARRGISRLAAAIDAQSDEHAEVVVERSAREASIVVPEPATTTPARTAPAVAHAPAPRRGVTIDEPTAAEAAAAEVAVPVEPPAAEAPADVAASLDEDGSVSGIGQLAALIDLNASRRSRRGGRAHKVGFRRHGHGEAHDGAHGGRPGLPAGAERALLSIVEVAPDPRNTLALQRDPTAQVTITEVDRAAARAAADRDRAEEAAARRRHPTAHRRTA